MLISAPISIIYIQQYSHIKIIIMDARLPYMVKLLKLSIYIEKSHEKTIHPVEVKNAPASCVLILGLLFGSQTYKSTNKSVNTNHTIIYLKY